MIFIPERLKNITKQAIKQRHKLTGFNDLLSYLIQLDDNTLLHKDGSLSKHFLYFPPDLDSSTDAELDAQSNTWQQAFAFLGDGWMVETQVVSQPFNQHAKPREFSELVSALIDDERKSHDQLLFRTHYYLSITWKPEKQLPSALRYFIFDETKADVNLDALIKQFTQKSQEYVGFLSRSIQINPLQGDQLSSFLYQCIHGHSLQLVKPYAGAFMDCYLVNEDFTGGLSPQIGKQHIKLLAIDDLPSYSYPAILDSLSQFPVSYRWSSRFVCLDPLTAKNYLKSYERSWSSKAIGVLGVLRESLGMMHRLDQDAEQTAQTIRRAQTENSAGILRYGFYNSVIVLMDEDATRLNNVADEISNHIQQLNFRVRIESVNATESYLGSLPCQGDYNLRKMMVDTAFVSHALPMSAVYQGHPYAPCPYYGKNEPALLLTQTQGNRPFWLNLHVNDVGHTAILGPTGSGKSTLIDMLMVAHRKYADSRIIILDKDYSHRTIIKALNGSYYDLLHNQYQLAPLARLSAENSSAINKAFHWLFECCVLQGVTMTPKQQQLLREGLERLANEDQEFKNLLHLSIQDEDVRSAIQSLSQGGYGHLLNGTQPIFKDTSVLGIDMSAFIEYGESSAGLNLSVIKAIFNELEILFQDRKPTLLVLEEAWLYLKHPLFQDKLTDWFKTLRKFNVAVIFVSQDLADIVDSNAASVIQNSCMTRIYLPNLAANEPRVAELYHAFGLNDRQVSIIQQAIPKQDYYYHSSFGNRLFNLNLGELTQSLLCISSKADLEMFEQLYGKEDQRWIVRWLEYKGLKQHASYVAQHYFSE